MLGTGAVVPGSGVALESVTEVPTVQVVVSQVIMASPSNVTWSLSLHQSTGMC